jgi:hypothetical protein
MAKKEVTNKRYKMIFSDIGKELKKIGKFELYISYLHSAGLLRADGQDTKLSTSEMRQDYLIVSFYLYRHSLELAMKRLAAHCIIANKFEELKGKDRHNLGKLWNSLKNSPMSFKDKIAINIAHISSRAWEVINQRCSDGSFEKNPKIILDSHINSFFQIVETALNIFKESKILDDEQLFRYEEHNNVNIGKLEHISAIPHEDVEKIEEAVWACYYMHLLLEDIKNQHITLFTNCGTG